jgi:hypothetical protein
MAVYIVYQPPARAAEAASSPEQFVFVRDGFSFWAFVLPPLWMLWRRLWLVLLIYVLAVAALQGGLRLGGGSVTAIVIVAVLIRLLVAMEAGTLRRWTLGRRGFQEVGIVSAADLEEAERRFYVSWVKARAAGVPPRVQLPVLDNAVSGPASSVPIVGLFPEPGAG